MQNKDLINFYQFVQASQINEANNEINKLLQMEPNNFFYLINLVILKLSRLNLPF